MLRDIQAAARIGHTESLWAALDRLLDLPHVAGNHPMTETFINQLILPVGEAVARARVNHAMLRPLITHPYAAFRAVAGVALLEQYLGGLNGTTLKDLNAMVQDPRSDVREALRLALLRAQNADPEKLKELYSAWQKDPSSRVQSLAYQILPNLPQEMLLEQLAALELGETDRQAEVKKTLASTLSTLGATGHADQVLTVLGIWAGQDDPDVGIIAPCLSSPWAADHPEQALEILTRLTSRTGPKKRIRKTLESLYRHGADTEVLATMERWRASENLNLCAAGEDEKLNFEQAQGNENGNQ